MALLNRVQFNGANETDPLRMRNEPVPLRPKWVDPVEPTSEDRTIYKNNDFTQLAIRTTPRGRIIWLKCLKTTASLYGWDQTFPTVVDAKTAASPTGSFPDPGRKGWTSGGGNQYRISRSEKTQGWPAGMTNSFRLSKQATRRDLQRVAEATTIDWTWMTCEYGGRRPRGWWIEETSTAG